MSIFVEKTFRRGGGCCAIFAVGICLEPNLPNFEELISKTSPHPKGFQTLLRIQVSAARLDGSRI